MLSKMKSLLLDKLPEKIANRYLNYLIGSGGSNDLFVRMFIKEKRKVDIGMYTYGSCFHQNFNVGGEVKIGRYCSIAGDVHYFGANHPIEKVSSSAYFYNKSFGYNVQDVLRSKLVIGNDVWIGYGAIITKGCCNIGNGAVIGAGSVVTHDVPAYAILAGNPGKIIRYRFSSENRDILEASEWWNYSPEILMKYYDSMNDINAFSEGLKLIEK